MGRLTPEEKKARRAQRRKVLLQAIRLPMVSGKVSALVLGLCLAVSAAVVLVVTPRFETPIWLRLELILAAWWVLWVAALASVLYGGKRVSDDHSMGQPRNWFSGMFGHWPGGGRSWGAMCLVGGPG